MQQAGTCHYQPFNEDKGTGLLRHCLLRRGVMTGQVMVVLVTAQPVLPGARNFVKALLTEAGKQGVAITTIVQNVNDRKNQRGAGRYGKGAVRQGLHSGYPLRQDLCHQPTQLLSDQSRPDRSAVRPCGGRGAYSPAKEVVLDAYCGIGTIGLTAADHAKQVVGVEVNRDAVHDAIGNAKHNGVKNARFLPPMPPGGSAKPPRLANAQT